MKFLPISVAAAISIGSATAQVPLSIVEGAACAQNAAHIEALEEYNKKLYDEIGEAQVGNKANASGLLLHYERMTAYRQSLISEYDLLCSRGTMSYSDFRKVCKPQSSGVSFEDTVFCAPLKGEE